MVFAGYFWVFPPPIITVESWTSLNKAEKVTIIEIPVLAKLVWETHFAPPGDSAALFCKILALFLSTSG